MRAGEDVQVVDGSPAAGTSDRGCKAELTGWNWWALHSTANETHAGRPTMPTTRGPPAGWEQWKTPATAGACVSGRL